MSGGKTVQTLYYNRDINRFIDDDDNIFDDIFRIITPNQFFFIRRLPGTYYFPSKTDTDVLYEFVFPFEEDEDDEY